MTRKKTIEDDSAEQLQKELMRRWSNEHYRAGMMMSDMELTVWHTCGMASPAALRHCGTWTRSWRRCRWRSPLRRVVARVGAQREGTDARVLHEELKPVDDAPEVLVVAYDGSMLPIRGEETWKEAKVGFIYRHDLDANKPIKDSARYAAVVNGLGEFAPVFEQALAVARTRGSPDSAVARRLRALQLDARRPAHAGRGADPAPRGEGRRQRRGSTRVANHCARAEGV